MASSIRKKLVIVGDGACGKTSLLLVFSKGVFYHRHIPTVFENHVHEFDVDGQHVMLELWDTAGQEDFDRLRPLAYPDADVVLIAFALDNLESFENVSDKWIHEIKRECPGVPTLLVGCKNDLFKEHGAVTQEQCFRLRDNIGAYAYVDCSSINLNVTHVFEEAVHAALSHKNVSSKKSKNCLVM